MDFRIIAVSEILPLKQGLKHIRGKTPKMGGVVSEILPLKQGLKLDLKERASLRSSGKSQRYFH